MELYIIVTKAPFHYKSEKFLEKDFTLGKSASTKRKREGLFFLNFR